MLKLKQRLDRTKKLKRLEEKTEILENITEARIAMHDIYNRELLQEVRNDSQAKYCDSELNHLGERSQKREQLDSQRAEVENFPKGDDNLIDREEISQKKDEIDTFFQTPKDARKRRSTGSKISTKVKRNKSCNQNIIVDAGQSTSVPSMDVQHTPAIFNPDDVSRTEDSIVDTTCDESESLVEKNTTEKAEKNDHEKLQSKRIKKNKNVADLLPDDQTHSKKPLTESHQNHNSTFNLFTKFNCEEDVDIESEYYDARKRHKIFYSWEDVIDKVDFRDTSKEDWIVESYNLSNEFRNFQLLTIQQVKESPYLCYKQDIQKILCLSNIMLIEHTKPSYLTVTSAIWGKIFRRQLPPSLPSVENNMALEYSSMLNSFTLLSDIQDVWCANFSKVAELNDQDKDKFCQAQIIFRNFLLLSSKGVNTNNEDTFVHETLHDLFKEIFHDSMFELIW
ncbi:hypothetical protein RclHR1_21720003 [Rhizophagus clarus]|uniref:Uncharacterized protein n=1 Tax=Rhizophagus clarus TaxID=94130 RepID=A0A2Z6QXY9_9GLOM|nr:hypothetical protein RclHR1_21720003 [Rhizophagus clarus]